MLKSKYHTATFPPSCKKYCLAKCSEHVLEMTESIFEILHRHSNESNDDSPWQILQNNDFAMQNNATVFGLKKPDIISSASTPSPEKSSQESSNPLIRVSSSSCLPPNLPFVDKTEGAVVNKYLVSPYEKVKILSDSKIGKMDFATTKDCEIKVNPKEENKTSMLSKGDISVLLRRNMAQIKSLSIIRKAEFTVEIEVDSACMPDESSPKSLAQDSCPSKKITSRGKSKNKIKSPTIGVEIDIDSSCMSDKKSSVNPKKDSKPLISSPGKPEKKLKSSIGFPSKWSTDRPPVGIKSRLTADYSDPNILNFHAEQLLSILSCIKTCMENIPHYYEKFLSDACHFHDTISHLKYVVEKLPTENEPYLTDDFLKFRYDFINKASEMLQKAKSLAENLKDDTNGSKKCLKEIDSFEKDTIPCLSAKSASKLNVTDLKKIELHLKDLSTKANGMLVIKDNRREILINSSSNFKWLINNFVKFLIITGILKPLQLDSSQIGNNIRNDC